MGRHIAAFLGNSWVTNSAARGWWPQKCQRLSMQVLSSTCESPRRNMYRCRSIRQSISNPSQTTSAFRRKADALQGVRFRLRMARSGRPNLFALPTLWHKFGRPPRKPAGLRMKTLVAVLLLVVAQSLEGCTYVPAVEAPLPLVLIPPSPFG